MAIKLFCVLLFGVRVIVSTLYSSIPVGYLCLSAAQTNVVLLDLSFTSAMLLSYGEEQVLQTPLHYVKLSDMRLV